MQDGGCCRHRAAALALILQEAGIPAQYTRGKLITAGRHAWVSVLEDAYLLDPNQQDSEFCENVELKTVLFCAVNEATSMVDKPDEDKNTIWRAKI